MVLFVSIMLVITQRRLFSFFLILRCRYLTLHQRCDVFQNRFLNAIWALSPQNNLILVTRVDSLTTRGRYRAIQQLAVDIDEGIPPGVENGN